jgi:hypothetical protein
LPCSIPLLYPCLAFPFLVLPLHCPTLPLPASQPNYQPSQQKYCAIRRRRVLKQRLSLNSIGCG